MNIVGRLGSVPLPVFSRQISQIDRTATHAVLNCCMKSAQHMQVVLLPAYVCIKRRQTNICRIPSSHVASSPARYLWSLCLPSYDLCLLCACIKFVLIRVLLRVCLVSRRSEVLMRLSLQQSSRILSRIDLISHLFSRFNRRLRDGLVD